MCFLNCFCKADIKFILILSLGFPTALKRRIIQNKIWFVENQLIKTVNQGYLFTGEGNYTDCLSCEYFLQIINNQANRALVAEQSRASIKL